MIAPSISSSCAVSCKILATSRFSMWLPCGWTSGPILLLSEAQLEGGALSCDGFAGSVSGLRLREHFFRACNILQHLLAQSFGPGEFLLVAQALQEAHLHQSRGQRLRKIEKMRFDRQALAVERWPDAHVRN